MKIKNVEKFNHRSCQMENNNLFYVGSFLFVVRTILFSLLIHGKKRRSVAKYSDHLFLLNLTNFVIFSIKMSRPNLYLEFYHYFFIMSYFWSREPDVSLRTSLSNNLLITSSITVIKINDETQSVRPNIKLSAAPDT